MKNETQNKVSGIFAFKKFFLVNNAYRPLLNFEFLRKNLTFKSFYNNFEISNMFMNEIYLFSRTLYS